MGVLEHGAAVVVDKAFRQRAFRDQNVVAVEFEVEIMDVLARRYFDDGHAIDEMLGRDQHAVEEHRVFRRHEKIARRDFVGQRSHLEADRQEIGIVEGETGRIGAPGPIHLSGRNAPEAVRTRSPIFRSSTATSPSAVAIRVPAQ